MSDTVRDLAQRAQDGDEEAAMILHDKLVEAMPPQTGSAPVVDSISLLVERLDEMRDSRFVRDVIGQVERAGGIGSRQLDVINRMRWEQHLDMIDARGEYK